MARKDSAEIEIVVKEIQPAYTAQELESCTALVCHSSINISSYLKKIPERNLNIQKALNRFKGLVVLPGETVSFYDVIGEPSTENGWLPPMGDFLSAEEQKKFPGIDHAATAVYSAAVMAGAEIIERHAHDYPCYYNDYGYGMDAYVEYGEIDLVFKNTTDYPMFFDAYLYFYKRDYPGYIDVDVYTMPLEDDMHIKIESIIVKQIPPPDTEYIEADKDKFSYEYWQLDEALNKMVYIHQRPRDEIHVKVYRVWYKDCIEARPGVWENGTEVCREEFDFIVYPGVQGVIYTKAISGE